MWFIEASEQLACIRLDDSLEFGKDPYINRDFAFLQKITHFSVKGSRIQFISEDGMLCSRSIRRPSIMKKVFRKKEREVFTTICILDYESSVLASASRLPNENDMKTTIYLLSRKLYQRSSLSITATTRLTACKTSLRS